MSVISAPVRRGRQSERQQWLARSVRRSVVQQITQAHLRVQAPASFDVSRVPVHPGEQSVPPIAHEPLLTGHMPAGAAGQHVGSRGGSPRTGGSQLLQRAPADAGGAGGTRQPDGGQDLSTEAVPGNCAESLQNKGTGLTDKPLGQVNNVVSFGNGVEIKFRFSFSSFPHFRRFRPVQWAGPESLWAKNADPLTAHWQAVSQDPAGKGPDDPQPEFIFKGADIVAFYDSPGPLVTSLGHFSEVVTMQNFTASVVGDPIAGGAAQHICQDIAWHGVVKLADTNWNTPNAGPSWTWLYGTESGPGWVDISKPPTI